MPIFNFTRQYQISIEMVLHIFYYCIINHHKLSDLKQSTFIISVSACQNLGMAYLDPLIQVSQGHNPDGSTEFSFRGSTEEGI